MSLRELEYVVAVDRERSFTRAAQQLHMAQPALSQAIIRLERRLDVRLFTRTSRRVDTTRAGQDFVDDATDIIERVRAAVERVTRAPGCELTVHVSEPALETPRRLLAAMRAAEADLSIHLTTLPSSFADTDSARAQMSLTIGHPITASGARSEAIRTERVGALMASHHPLAPQPDVDPADIARYPIVSIDDRLSRWNRWVTEWMARFGRHPRWTTSAVFGIVAGGDMAADGESLFVCLESVAADVGSGFTWKGLTPSAEATWYLNWMSAQAASSTLRTGIAQAESFARSAGWLAS